MENVENVTLLEVGWLERRPLTFGEIQKSRIESPGSVCFFFFFFFFGFVFRFRVLIVLPKEN